ncbi:helix-turn-helix domain-containing protein [Lactobacillus delbrueckii subsp. lactis]|uniref:helix-turn-helix domain-containing protein n=1 Tax=Lactobacillus delbrueckii TaxID=1584 RepID=UPI001109FCEA|nr:helix-turn-helix domain-containing protein [Lactobacillus delbrueckii]MBO1193637.1 helix-turn-helix domain-containing protein [Lactobacillus delbrueckii subsp. lactis]MCD5528255.1 helix-turn-helix domain-containing protein [Lactobacillus delbrueckii subsp. lactis]MCD5552634.1 helix-turn-helix domain-containing protein [Lactobacillus delbrueckii subsp. lactis]MCD5554440.1 helix-turn-helix domain-containing protein [Lactobacillus delbrueckii subsp. lactis]MCD5556323.1 helix-turn-helix domain-
MTIDQGLIDTALLGAYRINKAKKKLCNTEASIGQIAKEVGFLNQFNFTRSFKNSLELSPENYRKIYKNK